MCLLVVLAQCHRDFPLVVAANRDELLERPATPMTVLRESGPRIVGGRDELAGGTWLAANDAGVVAGLTNRPTPGMRDATKRSRGELPILLASHTSASDAVDAFVSEVDPSEYNPAWILVGDRDVTFAVDVAEGNLAVVRPLPPGVHILENRPLGMPSPKVEHVRRLVAGAERLPEKDLIERLQAVLADHHVPDGPSAADDAGREDIPPEVKAACVHTEQYGTRWSGIVTVPPERDDSPTVRYTDGPPCKTAYTAETLGGG